MTPVIYVLYLFLELHTDGIGFFEVYSIAPQPVSEGGELVVSPLPESPLGQLVLMLGPGHCNTGTNIQVVVILPSRISLLFLEQHSIHQTIRIGKGVGAYQPIMYFPLIVEVVLVGLRL